jgi:predicted dehydrogenase
MTSPVRWGILSTAKINDKVLPGLRGAAETEVVAVASRDGERARAYARERDIPRAHDSYEALLADPEVEVVYIPLPNALHVPWALRALEAGKHVLCEKPIARRAADAERAVTAAREHGRLLAEAFMYRHHPQTRRLTELVAEGAVGELRAVRSHFSFHYTSESDVRLSAELDGGALMDVGCYCVSAARLLAGEPEAARAFQVIGGDGVDIRFAATMRFAHGVLAHFDAGLDFADRFELEVVGSQGTLTLHDPWHCVRPGVELRRDGEPAQQIAIEAANPYTCQAENVSAAVRGEAELLVAGAEIVGQARAIEALYAAADRT